VVKYIILMVIDIVNFCTKYKKIIFRRSKHLLVNIAQLLREVLALQGLFSYT